MVQAAGFWSGVEEGVADADDEEVEDGSLLLVSGLADGDGVVHPLIATSKAMPTTGPTKRWAALTDGITRTLFGSPPPPPIRPQESRLATVGRNDPRAGCAQRLVIVREQEPLTVR